MTIDVPADSDDVDLVLRALLRVLPRLIGAAVFLSSGGRITKLTV